MNFFFILLLTLLSLVLQVCSERKFEHVQPGHEVAIAFRPVTELGSEEFQLQSEWFTFDASSSVDGVRVVFSASDGWQQAINHREAEVRRYKH